jgi:hypothetical protein
MKKQEMKKKNEIVNEFNSSTMSSEIS